MLTVIGLAFYPGHEVEIERVAGGNINSGDDSDN
jgi:hypothetical protein